MRKIYLLSVLFILICFTACTLDESGDKSTPTATPSEDQTPEPSPTTSIWRAFSDDSPWNRKISSNDATDPNSDYLIDHLSSNDWGEDSLVNNYTRFSIPVYYIDDSLADIKVYTEKDRPVGDGFGDYFDDLMDLSYSLVPIPADAQADVATDKHLCIIDKEAMFEWGMWHAYDYTDTADYWTTGLGAVMDLNSDGVRVSYDASNPGDPENNNAHEARASGFPLIAGLIRVEEIKAGKIEHALCFAYEECLGGWYIPPASTSQATKGDMPASISSIPADNLLPGIPMGGRIQLKPEFDIEAQTGWSESTKIIARAMQEYGLICGDYAGGPVIYSENAPWAIQEWGKNYFDTDNDGTADQKLLDTANYTSIFTESL